MSNPATVVYTTPPGPAGSHRDAVMAAIGDARYTVEFGVYAFTYGSIAAAILAAVKRGGTVRGLCDAVQAEGVKAQAPFLRAAGVDVRLVGDRYRLFHDKVLLVDGGHPRLARVVVGSHNWTTGAAVDNREVSLGLSGSWVSSVFAPAFRAQLDAAYTAGH